MNQSNTPSPSKALAAKREATRREYLAILAREIAGESHGDDAAALDAAVEALGITTTQLNTDLTDLAAIHTARKKIDKAKAVKPRIAELTTQINALRARQREHAQAMQKIEDDELPPLGMERGFLKADEQYGQIAAIELDRIMQRRPDLFSDEGGEA